jgi:ATP-dependent Clp protease ATP-binding subunit ClpC
MPKINVYLPDELAASVRDAQLPVSAICQAALERAVRDVSSARATDNAPPEEAAGVGMLGRFTPRARQSLTLAESAARDASHNFVGTEHLLLGMIDEGGNLGVKVLAALDVEPVDLRAELVASMEPPATSPEGHIPFTPLAKRTLEATAKEALALGHNYIGCEHILLGLLSTEAGLASKVMRRIGLELRTTRRAVIAALVNVAQRPRPTATSDPALAEILQRLDTLERRFQN